MGVSYSRKKQVTIKTMIIIMRRKMKRKMKMKMKMKMTMRRKLRKVSLPDDEWIEKKRTRKTKKTKIGTAEAWVEPGAFALSDIAGKEGGREKEGQQRLRQNPQSIEGIYTEIMIKMSQFNSIQKMSPL
jgi:hypothetical protein